MFTKIMLPVAAFAVTATSASAFHNTNILEQIDVDLTSAQIEVLESVHEMREDGADRSEIREALEDAGLDRDTMKEIREAVREIRQTVREAIKAAVAADDYDAFLEAAAGTKLGEVIDTESEFDRLVEAWGLKEDGDREGARAIMDDLGLERPDRHHDRGGERPARNAS